MVFDVGLISAHNGWAMAVTGAIIVMLGLSALSLIISQLHKVIALFESKAQETETETKPQSVPLTEADLLNDVSAAASLYKAVGVDLTEPFDLSKLYAAAQAENLPHAHITIRNLREAGWLVPAGDGQFSWKSE